MSQTTASLPGATAPPGPAPVLLLAQRREQLSALERDWKQLSRQAHPYDPFLSWEWQTSWMAAHPRLHPCVAAEYFPDGSLAGLLALQRVRRHGLSQLEFMSQGSGADELDCLLHPRARPGLAQALLAAARRCRSWDLLRLQSARADGALAQVLTRQPGCEAAPGDWLPFLQLPAGADAWLASCSANFRAEIRRRRRVFARTHPDASVECITDPAALGAGLLILYRLHNLRRTQRQGEGIFTSPALRAFHSRLGPLLARSGVARLYLLRTPAHAVAALYGFVAGDRFLYFQSGFDPAFTALSPGTVLLSNVVEDAIRLGLSRFELLRGDEAYKSRWTSLRRRDVTLLQAGSSLGYGYLRVRGWMHRLRRRGPTPPP